MFSKLRFTTRILLPPVIAAVAFLVLVFTLQVLNTLTARRLAQVETGLYPSLVLSHDLEAALKDVQRGFQDAQTLESPVAVEEVEPLRAVFRERLAEARENPFVAEQDALEEIEVLFERYYAAARQTSLRMVSQAVGVADADVERTRAHYDAIRERLSAFSTGGRQGMEEAFAQTRSRQRASILAGLVIAALSLIALGWSSYGVLVSVRALAREMTGSAARVNASSSQVLAATRQQEHSASQQASAIEETSRTIQSLAESARSIAELAEAVLENAQRTQETHQEIAERNSHLMSRLEGVATILESVKDIANKSELLALNAALEGTKAGETGRGFSLVAVQMQRLAENVMGNVRDIKRLTRDIRQASHSAVLAIEEGAKLAQQTTESASRIRMVTQQQESATQQVTESMGDAARQVQQTVAGVRQSAEAMESLTALATQLNQILDQLRLGRSGRLADAAE